MYNVRTDLAVESREINGSGEITGVKSEETLVGDIIISRVTVLNDEGVKVLNKPIGKYITVEFPDRLWYGENFEDGIRLVAQELENLIEIPNYGTVLIVGLGNSHVTPDALGPKSVEHIIVTRHLLEHLSEIFDNKFTRSVSAVAPGVLGQTGIESAEIIKGVVNKTNPDLVIVIDALASRRMKRLASTVQLSSTGIIPGAGVGNKRSAINQETLGVPVISIGVPMVVDAATLSSDVIDTVVEDIKIQADNAQVADTLTNFAEHMKHELIREILTPYDLNLVVTPREVDSVVENAAKLIGFAINKALHRDIALEDMMALSSYS